MSDPGLREEPTEPTQVTEPRGDRARRQGVKAGLYARAAVVLVLLAIIIALVASNTRHVEIDWVVGSTRASLVWVLFFTAVVGWLLGIATAALFRRRASRRRRSGPPVQ